MIQPSGGDLLCCISQTDTSSDSRFRVLIFDSIFALSRSIIESPVTRGGVNTDLPIYDDYNSRTEIFI